MKIIETYGNYIEKWSNEDPDRARWLLKTGWLKKIEDYSTMTTNIVIPDYAAVFIEAFERLTSEELEETELYIQNVYATTVFLSE